MFLLFFLYNDTATTEIYTLSLHDALPISKTAASAVLEGQSKTDGIPLGFVEAESSKFFPKLFWRIQLQRIDRKSTRLNSSHMSISYAVFCLKKKIKANKRQAL